MDRRITRHKLFREFLTDNMVNSKLSEPASTFHGFPRLPTEIRLLIWSFSRPDPRIIGLGERGYNREWPEIISTLPAPGIVYACKESREFALEHWYNLENRPTYPSVDLLYPIPYYFDPENDFMYPGCPDCNPIFGRRFCHMCDRLITPELRKTIKRVVGACDVWYSDNRNLEPFAFLACDYPNAQELILLNPDCPSNISWIPRWSDLVPSTYDYTWLGPGSFAEAYEEAKMKLDNYVASIGEEPHYEFNVTSFRCMELKVSPKTTKKYGFFEWRFQNMQVTELLQTPIPGMPCSKEKYMALRAKLNTGEDKKSRKGSRR